MSQACTLGIVAAILLYNPSAIYAESCAWKCLVRHVGNDENIFLHNSNVIWYASVLYSVGMMGHYYYLLIKSAGMFVLKYFTCLVEFLVQLGPSLSLVDLVCWSNYCIIITIAIWVFGDWLKGWMGALLYDCILTLIMVQYATQYTFPFSPLCVWNSGAVIHWFHSLLSPVHACMFIAFAGACTESCSTR